MPTARTIWITKAWCCHASRIRASNLAQFHIGCSVLALGVVDLGCGCCIHTLPTLQLVASAFQTSEFAISDKVSFDEADVVAICNRRIHRLEGSSDQVCALSAHPTAECGVNSLLFDRSQAPEKYAHNCSSSRTPHARAPTGRRKRNPRYQWEISSILG